jgi:hypothetical protein
MAIKAETATLSYIDDEGDNISIACDDDISIMRSLAGEKAYVKVNVSG